MSASPDEQIKKGDLINQKELVPILECLLFTTTNPLSIRRLSKILGDLPSKVIREAMSNLQNSYEQEGKGLQIVEVAGGFQMATHPRFAPYILKLNQHKKRSSFSIPALETLAIIAYKQPITRAEIEAIRGVDSSGVLRTLIETEVIKVTGKKEVPGRPPLYGTGDMFLKIFGLKRLADLPSLKDLRKMFNEQKENE